MTREDKEQLLGSLQWWGALDHELPLREGRRQQRAARLREGSRRRPQRRSPSIPSRSAARRAEVRTLGAFAAGRPVRHQMHAVAAGRRHGHDRAGFRARTRRPDPLRRQGHARSTRTPAASRSATRTPRRARRSHDARADWCVCTIPLSILASIDDECRRADARGDRRGPLCRRGQGRPAVQAPLLGRGRPHLRRHQLHRPADHADQLSEHRLSAVPARACCSAAMPSGPDATSSPR